MSKVSACVKVHTQYCVARLKKAVVRRKIGVGAAVSLHVGILRAEKLLCAFDGKHFGFIHKFAAAIVTPAGIALGILICVKTACNR